MSNKDTGKCDPFAFSLHGLRTVAAQALAPAVAGDRLNQAIAARLRLSRAGQRDPHAAFRHLRDPLRPQGRQGTA